MNADAVMKDRLEGEMLAMGRAAKTAAAQLALASSEQKNKALLASAAALRKNAEGILAANAKDLEAGRAKGLSAPLLDRLALVTLRGTFPTRNWKSPFACRISLRLLLPSIGLAVWRK